MRAQTRFFSIATATTFALAVLVSAQTPPPAPNAAERFIGEVASVDAEQKHVVLQEDKTGIIYVISFTDKTSLLRVPPGETDIKKATRIAATDISAGDRLLAVGQRGAGSTADARTIVIISKSDLALKRQHEQEEWEKNGISGIVAAVDAGENFLTVTVGDKKFKVQTSDKTEFRRYAADSAKFSDSQKSTFADLKNGDQIRALGEKNAEALTLKAERVVSGSFLRVVGTIKEMDAQSGQIKLTELLTGKSFNVRVTPKCTTRKLPPEVANLIAQRLVPGAQGRGGASGGLGALRASGGDINQILDRLPPSSIADLKPGSAIVVSGTAGAEPGRVTAITVITGIEPIANAVPNLIRDLIGGWNVGGGGDLAELPQ
jgi:hypothetical protein